MAPRRGCAKLILPRDPAFHDAASTMHLRLALSLVLIFGLAAARPFGNPEPYMAPSSLPFICEHVLYWFRRACFVMGPSHTSHIAGDTTHFANGFASSGFSWQFGPGLFGPLGWGENDITIIVSVLECPLSSPGNRFLYSIF